MARTTITRSAGASYSIAVIGAKPQRFKDLYHAFLRMSWWVVTSLIVLGFLVENMLFALLFWYFGGVVHASSGFDYFFFSVQTTGTIGYGSMYPETFIANLLVVCEAAISLVTTALATGLIFAKFSQPTGHMVFSKKLVVYVTNGVPTLMLRVGNERANQIIEATIRLVMVKTIKDEEGNPFYRMLDLPLVRERSPAISRSWTVIHEITAASPLYQYSPDRCAAEEVEIIATVMGTDDTSLQPVYGRFSYESKSICWGAKYTNILTESSDGNLTLDLRKFDDVEWLTPTEQFPYPAQA
jgi:inward rectifier potassium channel